MKLYCDKTRARYAAKRELAKGNLNAEPKEGVDFEIVEQDGRFAWVVPLSVQGYNDEAAHAPAGPVDQPAAASGAVETIFDLAIKRVAAKAAAEAQPADGKGRRSRTAQIEEALLVASAEREEEKRAEKAAKPKRFSRRASVKAMVDAAQDRAEARLDHAEQTLAAETAPEWPTSFMPDAENGEIASREYGMLLTRERAVEAAQAAGATDAVITQTGRGMFVWRTSQLDKVWKANAAPKPAAARKEKAEPGERPRRGGSKLDIAEKLLRRPEGATPEEIAAQVEGWDARTAKIRIGTCLKLTRKLPIESAVEEGRGKVYRIAA